MTSESDLAVSRVASWPRGPRRATSGPSLTVSRRRAQAIALAPLTLVLVALTIIPTLYILVVSFTNSAATNQSTEFIGLGNYAALLSNPMYWEQVLRTVIFVVVAVTVQLAIAVSLAVAMSKVKRGDALLRALILLPMAAAPIATLFNWRMILNASYGPLNYVLSAVGLPAPDWLGSPELALPTLMAIDTWQWTPFVFIILAGGLATIPSDVYEAASVDGASAWQQFWHVTLPLLMPYIVVAVLFRTVDALKTFDSVQVLTSGGPGSSTTMMNYGIFQQAISFLDFGKASAGAVLFLIICILLANALLSGLARKEAK